MWWMTPRAPIHYEHWYTIVVDDAARRAPVHYEVSPANTSGRIFLPAALLMVPSSIQGLSNNACHIIDCQLTQETRV